ncbi:MAG TPA: hypothetical protein VJ652_14990 [Noviherbaspirillum sp.]|nr:hypothetical protein [Noviherbaspirillum sp.]
MNGLIERLRRCHERTGLDVADEAADLLEQLRSELNFERSHRQQLQRALMFWLPMVPGDPEEISKRSGDDAMLLIGYEGDDEKSAEELGWLSLEYTQFYRYLRERDLDAIHKGGVFAGLTPDNIVLNGDDLDDTIRVAMSTPSENA